MFKLNKLKGRIVEVLGTNNKFMELMGWSKPTTYSKLEGKSDFSQSEIYKICEILHIDVEDVHFYFFQTENEFETEN